MSKGLKLWRGIICPPWIWPSDYRLMMIKWWPLVGSRLLLLAFSYQCMAKAFSETLHTELSYGKVARNWQFIFLSLVSEVILMTLCFWDTYTNQVFTLFTTWGWLLLVHFQKYQLLKIFFRHFGPLCIGGVNKFSQCITRRLWRQLGGGKVF